MLPSTTTRRDAERDVLNSHRAMRCTLYVVSIFELVLGIWYFGIGVAFYSGIEDRGAIEHVYYGFGAGAAAFVASAMGFITFGALFYTAHKEVFLNHVVPVALRQRGMCRCSCRVLGVLMVLILVQFMLMGWGLGTVLAAFGDEAADGDGADTIGGNEALALCDICGRILYFIVMLMVCIRFANLWANTVRAWMKAGDLNSGSPMKKVFTHGHYNEDLEQQFASAMAERASEADPSAADGSYVPVGDGGSAGNKRRSHPRELNLAAAAFGVASPASTASTPSFALAPAHVEDAEFIDLWNTLPPSGEFRLPVGVAPSFTPQLLSQHLSDQNFDVVGEGVVDGVVRVVFVGYPSQRSRVDPSLAFVGKLEISHAGAEFSKRHVLDADSDKQLKELSAEFKCRDVVSQLGFVSRLDLQKLFEFDAMTL